MRVYLAGPEVFLNDAMLVGAQKIELCAKYDLAGLFPLDNSVDLSKSDAARQIFLGNQRMMDSADAIVANLTPFRGPSADVGTVYELGYMIGRGKRALAYCNDPAPYIDRVARKSSLRRMEKGALRDADGLIVENFGGVDNLMITEGLATHGFPMVIHPSPFPDCWRDLTAFERCLQLLVGAKP